MGTLAKQSGVLSAVALAAATLLFSDASNAQDYPNKPIRLVNANAAGGVSDKIARTIARAMEQPLKATIVVESRPGGGGNIGVSYVLRAPADGYTLGHTCSGPIVSELMGETLPFDLEKDLVVIGDTASSDIIMVGRPDIGVNSIEDLIALARKRPGQLNIGMVQSPSTVVATAFLNKMEGIELKLVYYKGEAQAATDLLGGTLDFSLNSIGLTQQYLENGTMKGIFLLSQDRNPVVPNVPAVSDNRTKGGVNAQTTCLIFAPTGTPPEILQKLNSALALAVQDPAVKAVYATDGMVLPKPKSLQQAAAIISEIRGRWRLARDAVDLSKYK